MKIQLASDLHLERVEARGRLDRIVTAATGADLLILAGDIHNGVKAIDAFCDWPVPVVYIAGNHEFYGRMWEETRADLRRAAAGTNVRFLDDDRFDFGETRILGCTLWTDFDLPEMSRSEWMREVDRELDRHRIDTCCGPLRSQQLLDDHERSRRWLSHELARPFSGKTVVVSHHGPHPQSIHRRHRGSRLNAAFVSDLSTLVGGVDLWLHGHVHDSFDYRIGGCRVVANPAGYALKSAPEDAQGAALAVENPAFDPRFVLDLNMLDAQRGSIGSAGEGERRFEG